MFRSCALLLGLVLMNTVAADADQVPVFNVEPSCRAVKDSQIGGAGRTIEACRREEDQARRALTDQWSQFPKADTQRCTSLARLGGIPSYVELLTCLEMAREVRGLRNKNAATGATGGLSRDPAGNAAD